MAESAVPDKGISVNHDTVEAKDVITSERSIMLTEQLHSLSAVLRRPSELWSMQTFEQTNALSYQTTKLDRDATPTFVHDMIVLFEIETQIIGAFHSSGNVKARLPTKILIEATILCEQIGLYLDYICCDRASWNRYVWNILGIRATLNDIQCRVVHTCDKHRFLYVISDFPHLMKCARNTMMKHGFNNHNGRAHWEPVSTMWKLDNSAITLKVAPKLTRSHIFPNEFGKMRVDWTFHVFSLQVTQCMNFYKDHIEARYANVGPTRLVIGLMAESIKVRTSRFPAEALRLHSRKEAALDPALKFLDLWDAHAKGLGFLEKAKVPRWDCM
ncbi:hypothetical protein MRX96_005623 [Rhipicephalus microplus]